MNLKTPAVVLTIVALGIFAAAPSAPAQGTTFTYQGRLNASDGPATGAYDLRFGLFNAASGGTRLGTLLTNSATTVSNGLFTVTLDFGPGQFTGADRWLELGVRTNGNGAFTTLAPRQPVTAQPYAIMAGSASNLLGTLANGQLANSTVTVAAGTGLSGGGTVGLGGSTTLNNAGVLLVTGNPDITATTAGGTVTLGSTATNGNLPNLIVKRDGSGGFSAGSVMLSSNLYLPNGIANAGLIYSGTMPMLFVSGTGSANLFAGYGAGNLTMSGRYNTGIGYAVLDAVTTGGNNSALGYGALGSNTTGGGNTAGGVNAMQANTVGNFNTTVGAAALYRNTNGSANTVGGYEAMFSDKSGSNNTAIGYMALFSQTNGQANIALGYQAGYNLTGGGSNIMIGHPGLASDTNVIRIGSGQAQTYIAGQIIGDAAGLTNLNAASLTGILPGLTVDDGGSAAFDACVAAARSLSQVETVAFGSMSLISSNSGVAPGILFSLDGTTTGTTVAFVGQEAISELSEFIVEVVLPGGSLVPDAQLGRRGCLTISRNGQSSQFAGLVTGCSLSSDDGTNMRYTFRLEPPLARMALTADYRMFQNQMIPDMVRALYTELTTNTCTASLTGSYATRDSVLQYAETSLNFISRLMEEEGIFYFFDTGSTPGMILGDSPAAYLTAPNSPYNYYGDQATNPPASVECVRAFRKAAHQSSQTVTWRNYNFESPATTLQGSAIGTDGQGTQFLFGGPDMTKADLDQRSRLRVERQEAEHNLLTGVGNAPDLRPGYSFTLADQTSAGLSGSYVVTSVRHGAFRRMTNGVASFTMAANSRRCRPRKSFGRR